jgi:hypothetical protein
MGATVVDFKSEVPVEDFKKSINNIALGKVETQSFPIGMKNHVKACGLAWHCVTVFRGAREFAFLKGKCGLFLSRVLDCI